MITEEIKVLLLVHIGSKICRSISEGQILITGEGIISGIEGYESEDGTIRSLTARTQNGQSWSLLKAHGDTSQYVLKKSTDQEGLQLEYLSGVTTETTSAIIFNWGFGKV